MDARRPLLHWHQAPLGASSPDRPMVRRWLRGEYDNVWVLRFGPDGRCAEFHEWYAGRPEHDPSRAASDGRAEPPA